MPPPALPNGHTALPQRPPRSSRLHAPRVPLSLRKQTYHRPFSLLNARTLSLVDRSILIAQRTPRVGALEEKRRCSHRMDVRWEWAQILEAA